MHCPDSKRELDSQFIRRGLAAIEATKHNGSGIPAALVIAKLEAKLAAAKKAKSELPPFATNVKTISTEHCKRKTY